jgi:cation:H+ antiporter
VNISTFTALIEYLMWLEVLGYLGLLIVSLAVLLKASDWFVTSAETIGLGLGVSPYVIGATVVAFGTSLPELASSIVSVQAGASVIVVGNVVGSNVANLLLVGGAMLLAANILPLSKRILRFDLPLLVASSLVLWWMLRDQQFTMAETLVCLGGMLFFLGSTFFQKQGDGEETIRPRIRYWLPLLLLASVGLVYLGAEYTVKSIQGLSLLAGISPEVIALTVVAVGTSLPELVVSLTAVKRGGSEIALGNIMGSNIFNAFAVMGIPRLVGELEIPDGVVSFSLPFMLGAAILFALFGFFGGKLYRWQGWLFLALYVVFVIGLLLI